MTQTLEQILSKKQPVLQCCIYFLIEDCEVVYVGQSINGGFDRIGQHLNYSDKNFDNFVIEGCAPWYVDEKEAAYILKFRPILNRRLPQNDRYKSLDYIQSRFKRWNINELYNLLAEEGITIWWGKYIDVNEYLEAFGG